MGHEIVGNLAYELLSEEVQVMVDQLLGDTTNDSSDTDLVTSMGKVASWADVVRYIHAYHWTTPLHYVDIHDALLPQGCTSTQNCHFEYAQDCTNDMCAVAVIQELVSFLSTSTRSTRLTKSITPQEGLKFLIHFIGDIHQPLHVSRHSDRGGNDIHIQPPLPIIRTTIDRIQEETYHEDNLHAVWDDAMIDYALHSYHDTNKNQQLQHFQQDVASVMTNTSHDVCPIAKACTTLWAQQSLSLALTKAYLDEHNQPITSGTTLTLDYYTSRLPIIKQQLALAASRLAATLEYIYSNQQQQHK